MVRERAEQELEDGVVLAGAFKAKGQAKNLTDSEHSDHERAKRQQGGPEYYQNIWRKKSSTPRFQQMLVSRTASASLLPDVAQLTPSAISDATTYVELQTGRPRYSRSRASCDHMR